MTSGHCNDIVNLPGKVAGWRANLFAIEVLRSKRDVNEDELKTSFLRCCQSVFSCFEMSVLKIFRRVGNARSGSSMVRKKDEQSWRAGNHISMNEMYFMPRHDF